MNIVIIITIIIIKEEYHFIMYLLTCSLKNTCSYFKTSAKPEHNTKITHIPNVKIPERKYNINERAVCK